MLFEKSGRSHPANGQLLLENPCLVASEPRRGRSEFFRILQEIEVELFNAGREGHCSSVYRGASGAFQGLTDGYPVRALPAKLNFRNLQGELPL